MADKDNPIESEDPIKAAAEAADAPEQEQQGEITPEHGIEALKIQLENERKARAEAERRAFALQQHAQKSEADVQDSNLQLVISAIDTVKRDNAIAKRAYSDAMAAGDFDKAAEIQDVMSMNNSKLLQLENGRSALEARASEARKPQQQQQQPQFSDPVEAVASQLSPRSASWIRAHPECVKNQKTYTKMIGLHNVAIADGIVPDSDEYFEYIETNLGYRKQRQQDVEQDADPQATAAKPMARKPMMPAAPPSRGSSGGNNRITLTAAQREAADISGVSYEDYAKNMLAERKRRSN